MGRNTAYQCDVGSWTNIVQVAAAGGFTVGLKGNGTAVAEGTGPYGIPPPVPGGAGIVQVAAGSSYAVGLRADGTLVGAGSNYHSERSFYDWDLGEIETIMVTVHLRDSNGGPLGGGIAQYYSNGWKDFGTIGAVGQVRRELLPEQHRFRMTYAGAYIDKYQDVSINPVVVFQTVRVTVELRDSEDNLIDTGKVACTAGNWVDFGTTSGGQVSKELLPKQYKFHMTYAGAFTDIYQDVAVNPTVVFRTVKVTVRLRDSSGNPLDAGKVTYCPGGWKDFGTTSGGEVSQELLPKQYRFCLTYAASSNEVYQDVSADPVVQFQTGRVVSDTGTCGYFCVRGSLQRFTNGMELLPGTYKFRFNDGTPDTFYPVVAGTVTHVH